MRSTVLSSLMDPRGLEADQEWFFFTFNTCQVTFIIEILWYNSRNWKWDADGTTGRHYHHPMDGQTWRVKYRYLLYNSAKTFLLKKNPLSLFLINGKSIWILLAYAIEEKLLHLRACFTLWVRGCTHCIAFYLIPFE